MIIANKQLLTLGLNLGSIQGDPVAIADGDIWFNANSKTIRLQQNGMIFTIVDPTLQEQINSLKILLAKLVMNQVSIGIGVEDDELIELMNEVNL